MDYESKNHNHSQTFPSITRRPSVIWKGQRSQLFIRRRRFLTHRLWNRINFHKGFFIEGTMCHVVRILISAVWTTFHIVFCPRRLDKLEGIFSLAWKAQPSPMRDVELDSCIAMANGSWLWRFVRRRIHNSKAWWQIGIVRHPQILVGFQICLPFALRVFFNVPDL